MWNRNHLMASLLGATAMLGISGLSATAQNALPPLAFEVTPTIEGQAQAQAIVDKAVEAAGGLDALQAWRTGRFTLSTRRSEDRIGQAPSAELDRLVTLGDADVTTVSHTNRGIAVQTALGDAFDIKLIFSASGVDWVQRSGGSRVFPDYVRGISGSSGAVERLAVTSSAHLLLELLKDPYAISYAGRRTGADGRTYETLFYAGPTTRLQTLLFDVETGHLAAATHLRSHAQWGDVLRAIYFSDYRVNGDVTVAHRWDLNIGPEHTFAVTLENVELGADIDLELFTRPDDVDELPPLRFPTPNLELPTSRTLELEELGPDVYFIAEADQGYNQLLIKDRDGIIVIDAPWSPQVTRDVMAAVEKRFPGTPIKMVIPTHHHFDTTGGLATYMNAGVRVMTTPGNVDLFRKIGQSPRGVIATDLAPRSTHDVRVLPDNYVIDTGRTKVQLINFGPNPQADEILAAYIPSLKSMFVVDLFNNFETDLPFDDPFLVAFAETLSSLDLDIETFLPAHGERASMAEFTKAVQAAQEALSADVATIADGQ